MSRIGTVEIILLVSLMLLLLCGDRLKRVRGSFRKHENSDNMPIVNDEQKPTDSNEDI